MPCTLARRMNDDAANWLASALRLFFLIATVLALMAVVFTGQ